MNKEEKRASLVRRACEHVLLRDVPRAKELAEALVEGVIAEHPGMPNWRLVLRLVEEINVECLCHASAILDAENRGVEGGL